MPDPLQEAGFLPFQLDLPGRRLLLVRLDAGQRGEAAFLDQRALPPQPEGCWVPLDAALAVAARTQPARLDWIFHIGHCGSTLLSRLLQAWPELQVLREPLPLRTLAEPAAAGGEAGVLHGLATLWSRPLPPQTRTLVKATSSCNALAAPLLAVAPHSRALLLDMPLPAYLATVLKAPQALADVAAAAPGRRRVLATVEVATNQAALEAELAALDPARQCAMGWLAEQLRFRELASGAHRERVLRVDFEALLAQPHDTLAAVAAHLGLSPAQLPAALASPWWRRYAKAGEHAYGVEDREHDLALAQRRHGDAIAATQDWLRDFLQRHPHIARRAGG